MIDWEKLGFAKEMVMEEFIDATRKFGAFHSTHEGYAVLLEEMDELWYNIKTNKPHWKLRQEAKQVAAMAIRFIYDLCPPPAVDDSF